MLRIFLILLSCALFAACSSDDSTTLNEWFSSQPNPIPTSYGKDPQEIEILLKSYNSAHNDSAYMVSSYATLGNVNGIEQSLYFGLAVLKDSMSYNWKLRADTVFYKEFYNGEIPDNQKTMDIKFCWQEETTTEHDTLWLKFPIQPTNCKETKLALENDTFRVQIPSEIKSVRDTLKLLVHIESLSSNGILRIAPPSKSDIPGLLRVAQKTDLKPCGDLCLRAGVRESINVVFDVREIRTEKTIVFAQLVLQKSSDTTGSELGHPVPVYVYNESYIVDTNSVETYGHPNLLFWEGDTLKLQVTKYLRNYVPNDTLTLRFGNPVLEPKSPDFSTTSRPAYSSYDFSKILKGQAKLRLWYAK